MLKLFFLLLICVPVLAKPSICEMLKLDNCNNSKRALSRSNSASFPNTTSAALNNPAAVAMDRGFGIESVFYKQVGRTGIVTGTGRVGAAISTASAQETFFNHYSLETPTDRRARLLTNDVYEPDNTAIALATNVFGSKNSRGLRMDIGGIYRHNGQRNSSYGGAGVSLGYRQMINVGYSKYRDVLYNEDELIDIGVEVENQIAGIKLANLALDYLVITTKFDNELIDESVIKILSASLFYQRWIFTYGKRQEESFREIYKNQVFETPEVKHDGFLGVQYAIGDHFILGLYQNYYLLNEVSAGIAFFW